MKDLEKLYYDPSHPAGYAGARKLEKYVRGKIPGKKVIEWLKTQDTYTLHKPVRRRFRRAHYSVYNIDDVWEADLVDLRAIKDYNDGYSYLLVVIDVLSKYAWVIPLLDKTAAAVTAGFKDILLSSRRSPLYLQTDKGKEFVASSFRKYLNDNHIGYRVTRSPDVKAAIVERFNRTLKERMWRYFTHKQTHRYVDVLEQLVQSYNRTVHSSIKMPPAEVTLLNAAKARANIESRFTTRHANKPKFKIGDLVRIAKARGAFDKAYQARWKEEIFKIHRVLQRKPPMYVLHDLADEEIDGAFYEPELQSIIKDLDTAAFKIDKIIRSKGRGRSKRVLVSWLGYPEKFNSWIPADSVESLRQ